MHVERQDVPVTTDSEGAAVVYSERVTGRVLAIRYVKPGSGGFDNGVTFDVVSEATGEVIWDEDAVNASKSVYPRAQVHTVAGVAAVLDADDTPMRDAIHLANDRVKFTIGSGGATKVGTFHLVIG